MAAIPDERRDQSDGTTCDNASDDHQQNPVFKLCCHRINYSLTHETWYCLSS